jgi:hypothetical protein
MTEEIANVSKNSKSINILRDITLIKSLQVL